MRPEHCDPDRGDLCQIGATLALELDEMTRRYHNGHLDAMALAEARWAMESHLDECRVWDFEGIPILRT